MRASARDRTCIGHAVRQLRSARQAVPTATAAAAAAVAAVVMVVAMPAMPAPVVAGRRCTRRADRDHFAARCRLTRRLARPPLCGRQRAIPLPLPPSRLGDPFRRLRGKRPAPRGDRTRPPSSSSTSCSGPLRPAGPCGSADGGPGMAAPTVHRPAATAPAASHARRRTRAGATAAEPGPSAAAAADHEQLLRAPVRSVEVPQPRRPTLRARR